MKNQTDESTISECRGVETGTIVFEICGENGLCPDCM